MLKGEYLVSCEINGVKTEKMIIAISKTECEKKFRKDHPLAKYVEVNFVRKNQCLSVEVTDNPKDHHLPEDISE